MRELLLLRMKSLGPRSLSLTAFEQAPVSIIAFFCWLFGTSVEYKRGRHFQEKCMQLFYSARFSSSVAFLHTGVASLALVRFDMVFVDFYSLDSFGYNLLCNDFGSHKTNIPV